jgi:hypothetical protein
MSEGSRRKAEQKIGLSRRLAKLGTKQFALAI